LTLPVFLRRAAELDLAAIEEWYDSQREGLGAEFRQVVDEAITRIADSPLSYPERYRGARRVLLRRFPYVLWYRPFESLVVVWHACTASVTRGTSVLGFAGGRNVVGNPDLWPELAHRK
jgi:plasmid stabilization system protein ParE